jgi:hypothetical protein
VYRRVTGGRALVLKTALMKHTMFRGGTIAAAVRYHSDAKWRPEEAPVKALGGDTDEPSWARRRHRRQLARRFSCAFKSLLDQMPFPHHSRKTG